MSIRYIDTRGQTHACRHLSYDTYMTRQRSIENVIMLHLYCYGIVPAKT